ncbi:MAG TPA: hypothetical protein VEO53_11450 [Candidatus Binatia bacterium]|nr:hypothetical protein [Candidatus Binatia bacterium]
MKEAQIDGISLHQAEANELVHQVRHFGITTNNLFVKAAAAKSRHTAENNEQRAVRFRGGGEGLGEVVVDPPPIGLQLSPVRKNALPAILTRTKGSGRQQQPDKG